MSNNENEITRLCMRVVGKLRHAVHGERWPCGGSGGWILVMDGKNIYECLVYGNVMVADIDRGLGLELQNKLGLCC